jgi:hypothetical protein
MFLLWYHRSSEATSKLRSQSAALWRRAVKRALSQFPTDSHAKLLLTEITSEEGGLGLEQLLGVAELHSEDAPLVEETLFRLQKTGQWLFTAPSESVAARAFREPCRLSSPRFSHALDPTSPTARVFDQVSARQLKQADIGRRREESIIGLIPGEV